MGIASKVMTISKDTDGTGTQVITGVGFTPTAAIAIWSGRTSVGNAAASFTAGFGFAGETGGTITNYSVAGSSQDGAASSNSSRRIANKFITIAQYGESLLAEADVDSFDSDGCTLDWTTNDANATLITILFLGGSSLTDAIAITWSKPGATGSQAISSVGFEPDCLFTGHTNNNVGGTAASAAMALGCTDGTDEWVVSLFDFDAQTTMDTDRGHRSNAVAGGIDSSAVWGNLADFTSFDANGFTLNWSARTNSNSMIALALKGGNYKVGTTAKTSAVPAPQSQSPGSLGFDPEAVLSVATWGGSLTGAGAAHLVMSLGVGNDDDMGAIAIASQGGVSDANVHLRHETNRIITKINDAGTVAAVGELLLTVDEFAWLWTTQDAAAGNISWLAIGPPEPPPAPTVRSRTVVVT